LDKAPGTLGLFTHSLTNDRPHFILTYHSPYVYFSQVPVKGRQSAHKQRMPHYIFRRKLR